MSFLVASFKKDLSRWWQDPLAVLLWLGIPFLIGGLITAMVDGGDGASPTGILLIHDEDESLISGFIAGAYSQGQLGELISVEQVTLDEGTERINAGEASGFLIIPDGFGAAFLEDKPVTLTLKTNPAQTILPGIMQDVTEILLDFGFYAQALFGPEIEQINNSVSDTVPNDVFVADIAVKIQGKIDTVSPLLFPPAFDVKIVEPPPAEPRPDIALLFLPGIVLMAILFSAQGLSADFWKERQTGTLRRLVSTSGLLSRFVYGKALAAAVVIGLLAGIDTDARFSLPRPRLEQARPVPGLGDGLGRRPVRLVCGTANAVSHAKSRQPVDNNSAFPIADDGRQLFSARRLARLDRGHRPNVSKWFCR